MNFPGQGDWCEAEYLAFPGEQTCIELDHGFIEVLPSPNDQHQAILKALLFLLDAYARRVGGRVRTAGLRVRLQPERFREPDLVFISSERLHLRGPDFWTGADLVIEIVSGGPQRPRARPGHQASRVRRSGDPRILDR